MGACPALGGLLLESVARACWVALRRTARAAPGILDWGVCLASDLGPAGRLPGVSFQKGDCRHST
jgi:hypothetical protein